MCSVWLKHSRSVLNSRRITINFSKKILGNFGGIRNETKCAYFSSGSVGEDLVSEFMNYWESGKPPEKFNFSKDVFDRHAVSTPEKLALWMEAPDGTSKKWTFRELSLQSKRTAILLRKILGDLPQQPPKPFPYMFTLLGRVPEWWYLHLAAIRTGVVFCPGTTMLTVEDVAYRLETSRAAVIVTNMANVAKVDQAHRSISNTTWGQKLQKVVVSEKGDKAPTSWIDFSQELNKISESEVENFVNTETLSDDLAQAYFTSGTTGKPKMVAHTHASYGMGHSLSAKWIELRPDDIFWNLSDPGWAKSSYSNFFIPWTMGCGAFVHQMEKFEAGKILTTLCEREITTLCAPPTLYKTMVQEPEEKFKFKSLRVSVGGGEPVNPPVAKLWEKKSGIKLTELFGQTEMVVADFRRTTKEGSLGVPGSFFKFKILNANMEPCKPYEEGQISVLIKPRRPIGLFKGYLTGSPNGPVWDVDKNSEAFVGDYYLTGDNGYLDESGHLFFSGRGDDVINSSGYRIGPTEIETVLQTHPAVVECAAVASPDPHRTEVVKAFIILSSKYKQKSRAELESLKQELQDYVKLKTAPYKYPRKVEFVNSLPKTVSNKILRRELKKQEFKNYKIR